MKDLAFQRHKYKSKLKLLRYQKSEEPYDSSSDVESEGKLDTSEDFPTQRKASFSKEQFSKSLHSLRRKPDTLEIREQSKSAERLKNAELQKIPDNDFAIVPTENKEASQSQLSSTKGTWPEEHDPVESNEATNSPAQDVKQEDHANEEGEDLESKIIHTDASNDEMNYNTFKQNNVYEEARISSNLKRKEAEEDSARQACERQSVKSPNHSHGDNHPVYNSGKDYYNPKLSTEKIASVIDRGDGEALNKTNFNYMETAAPNRFSAASSEAGDIKTDGTLSRNAYASRTERSDETKSETASTKQSDEKKRVMIGYNKEKLLATMRAIDDNENIEYLNQGLKNPSLMNRMQITENLYRGLPTHSKPKREIIKDIFEDNHIDNKVRGSCSKSH